MILEVKDSTNSNGKGKANGKNTNKSIVLKISKEGHCSASLKKKQYQRGAGASSNDIKPASESAKKNQRNRLNHGQNGGYQLSWEIARITRQAMLVMSA